MTSLVCLFFLRKVPTWEHEWLGSPDDFTAYITKNTTQILPSEINLVIVLIPQFQIWVNKPNKLIWDVISLFQKKFRWRKGYPSELLPEKKWNHYRSVKELEKIICKITRDAMEKQVALDGESGFLQLEIVPFIPIQVGSGATKAGPKPSSAEVFQQKPWEITRCIGFWF